MSRTIGYSISPTVVANRGTGPTLIIWCTAGVSGIEAPAIRAMRGLQTPQAMTTTSALTWPRSVWMPRMRPSTTSMPEISVWAEIVSAPMSRAASRMSVPARSESTTPTPGVWKPSRMIESSTNGTRFFTSAGVMSSDVDAPRLGRGHPAAQLLAPLLGARDLDAAALREDAQLAVLADAVERELGHLLAVVGQEDEVRGVAGRAARVRERALVEQQDVAPAEPRQVVGHAVADDAGADDDDACVLR